ncbi:MAG: TraR/DksA family transcriptional regulator [Actinobacteria bacterium]|nr:TraR/DksA family transcriptional regulator [Actinomycetota bacterium]MBW3649151.1 TraR/DksA family transcriptional regulator [Actinomycetota bacterium]
MLLAQRQAHLDNLEALRAAAAQLLDDSPLVDSVGDDGFGEADGSGSELDRIRTLVAAARKGIDDVDAALGRLDSGRYGICADCRAPISPARLEAIPEATHCVDCKTGGLRRRK